jgi:signal transduction histidine kinase
MRLAALRVPLAAKVVGANLAVVAVLTAVGLALGASFGAWAAVALVGVVALHTALMAVALRPIRDLEEVASRVWRGDFGARVERSAIADQEVLRIGAMFNILLDGLAADRARMRALASEVIEVGDRERAVLARELHDSTAQRLAALLLQISTAARDCKDAALAERLIAARDATQELTEEVRLLAQTVHPRVLDDLGLVAALRKLARDSSSGTGIHVDVDTPAAAGNLPHTIGAVLYRVAQEAVRNAIRHASPRHVYVSIDLDDSTVRLEIRDDGCGFDLSAAEHERRGMGLMSMRERVALVDGWLELRTAKGGGTAVIATIPLAPASEITR